MDQVKFGENPNCVLFDPKAERILTADRGSQRVSVIGPKSGKVIGTVESLGGKVEYAVWKLRALLRSTPGRDQLLLWLGAAKKEARRAYGSARMRLPWRSFVRHFGRPETPIKPLFLRLTAFVC